jgi:hypothetical protein
MGMYTEFFISFELKPSTPQSVIQLLRVMMFNSSEIPPELPKHPLFNQDEWQTLFTHRLGCVWGPEIRILEQNKSFRWDFAVRIATNKFYLVEAFIDWIYNWVEHPFEFGLIGYEQYEGSKPKFLYLKKNETVQSH